MNNTKVIHEELEQNNIYIELLKLTIRALKLSLYICISFIEMFIKLLKALFGLNEDYRPFKAVTDTKNTFFNHIAQRNINQYKIQFASDILSRHEYNFEKSEQFLAQYKYLQDKLKDMAENKVLINEDIYRDIFKRISILVSEAENKALQEGYNHARKTRYRLYDQEIYEDYIRDKVLKGEANTDWRELKERLENE